MRLIDWIRTAAAVLLSTAMGSANARAQQALPFRADWGPNLLAAENGCQIQKTVNHVSQGKNADVEFGPANLIDSKIDMGRPYSAWDLRKGPGEIVLKLPEPKQITRFVLLNDSSNGGGRAAKEITIAVLSESQKWQDVQTHSLTKNPKMQALELPGPVTALAVRLTIKSGFTVGFAILEEFAAFGAGEPAPAEGAAKAPPAIAVLRGTEEHDVMELKNGDVLTGKMLNETLQLQTSFARISFRYEEMASLFFGKGAVSIDGIIVLNGDIFGGYLLDKTISFQLATGQQIEVRREKINRLGVRTRETEEKTYPRHDVIVLKNGITFSGKVMAPQVTVQTTYATVPTRTADIALIQFMGDDRVVTKVTLINENTMQGVLAEEDIAFDLDFGPEILIYQDKIATIKFQERLADKDARVEDSGVKDTGVDPTLNSDTP